MTASYVLLELAALMMSPLQLPHAARVEIIVTIRATRWIDVVHVDEDYDRRSREIMSRHRDKRYSLVDCSSFVLMKDRGLSSALTTDRHFEQAGFGFVRLLRPH